MYFDFEDHRPDTPTIARPLSRREGRADHGHRPSRGLVIADPARAAPAVRAGMIEAAAAGARGAAAAASWSSRSRRTARFVFVQPRLERPGAEAAAARRSLGHRSPGAHDRAGAEADQSAAVRARQHHRADRARAAGRARRRTAAAAAGAAGRSAEPPPTPTLPESPNGYQRSAGRAAAAARRRSSGVHRRRHPQRAEVRAEGRLREPARRRRPQDFGAVDPVRHQGRRVRAVAARASSRRSAATGSSRRRRCRCTATSSSPSSCTRTAASPTSGGCGPRRSTRSRFGAQRDPRLEPDHAAAARVSGRQGVLHRHVLLQRKPGRVRDDAGRRGRSRSGCCSLLAVLVALALVARARAAP